jgi:hypothetical protein
VTEQPSTSRTRFSEFAFYPLLFAVFIPVNFLAQNITLFAPSQALRAVLCFLAAAWLIAFVVNLWIRDKHGSALLTSMLFAGIWVYQFAYLWRGVYVVLLLAALWVVWRKLSSARSTALLNLVLAAILLQPLFLIANEQLWLEGRPADALTYSPFIDVQAEAGSKPLPNVVHILLDGYAGSEVLDSIMGFDNSEFELALEALGFAIAADARTPYNQTLMVMASIYSGTYLESGQPPLALEDVGRVKLALGQLVSNGPVKNSLAELGYRFLYTDPGFDFWRFGGDDVVSSPATGLFTLNTYEQMLVERTSLNFLPRAVYWMLGRPSYYSVSISEAVQHAVDTDFYRSQEVPYVLYEHVLAPHPPFNLDRNGADTDKWSQFGNVADGAHATKGDTVLQRLYIEGYLEKLRYVNGAMLEQLQSMIRDIPSPKVIMLHGDHGGGAYYFPDEPARSCLQERYSPFLAVYSDDPDIQAAFAHIKTDRVNLVNLYRILFDARFGTEMGRLDDQSWFTSWKAPQQPEKLADARINAACELLPDD